jgi:hypothetical protein
LLLPEIAGCVNGIVDLAGLRCGADSFLWSVTSVFAAPFWFSIDRLWFASAVSRLPFSAANLAFAASSIAFASSAFLLRAASSVRLSHPPCGFFFQAVGEASRCGGGFGFAFIHVPISRADNLA